MVCCGLAGILLSALVPSRSQVEWIIGAGTVATIAQTPAAQELPENLLDAANAFLKQVGDQQ